MALFRRKVGDHLSPDARKAICEARAYRIGVELRNPMFRRLLRQLASKTWSARLADLDFPYTMQDVTVADVPCVAYGAGRPADASPFILYAHGGGFVSGSARDNAAAALPLCKLTGSPGLGVGYSRSPEAVFPRALDEIEAVYLALIETRDPRSIVFLGDSAGGNLALASLLRWRDRSIPLPAGAILYSPTLDAAASSDTMQTLKDHDPFINGQVISNFRNLYHLYAPGEDIRNPYISPLYADLSGLPPLLLQVGAREALLGDAARLANKARRDGADATLRVYDGMFHLFHTYWTLEEARDAQAAAADFIRTHALPDSA